MRDQEGNTLCQVGDDSGVAHTFTLRDGEVVVGFRSALWKNALHYRFQLVVMRDIEAEELFAWDCWHRLFVRVRPQDSELKGLQMNLFRDIMAFDGVRVEFV